MADRVFHERLHREGRDEALHRGGLRVEARLEAVAQPQALEVQVGADEGPFVVQRNLVEPLALHAKAVAQQIAETLRLNETFL